MKLTAPDAGWDSLSTPIRPGLMYAGNICMDSPIDFLLQKTLPLCGREKAWINFDSTCGANNWIEVDSNSGGGKYQIQKIGDTYKCNCPGYYRSKDRICKHIKQIIN
jgi:hypothetical protein